MKISRTDESFILKWAKKIKYINFKGGKCIECGEDNIFKLCFHHPNDDKEYNITNLKHLRSSTIKKEVDKCILFCHNCHSKYHYDNKKNYKHNVREKNKKIYLEYKNVDRCEKCGYNECNQSLVFHHKRDKLFRLSSISNYIKNINHLRNKIKKELDKCIVLCHNCHNLEHSLIDKFKMYENKIYEKIDCYKEPMISDKKLIIELRLKGYSYNKIVKETGYSKTTIQNELVRRSLSGDIRKLSESIPSIL